MQHKTYDWSWGVDKSGNSKSQSMNIGALVPDVTKTVVVCQLYYLFGPSGGTWYSTYSYDSSTGLVTATLTTSDDAHIVVHMFYLE